MLTRSDIDDILRLIDSSDFLELKLEMGDLKLELRRPGAVVAQPAAAVAPVAVAPAAAPVRVAAPVIASGGGSEVPAPLLGIFWHAPRPGAAPFVKPGDKVTPDTVIGIIEVMKLMNSVPAGIAGTVVEITAPNGEMVEHGQTLIRIQPE
jgi:acetyl-CoA carboxylase biotin carboxyl carrier protein